MLGANNGNYQGSYGGGDYGGQSSYGGGDDYGGATLRRRNQEGASLTSSATRTGGPSRSVVKKLDFMFPKVDQEYTVKTEGGGVASLVAYVIIAILILADSMAWSGQNNLANEQISVDQSLGKRMKVYINVTFPGLACEDLHVDVMDVAGDSQLNIEDSMKKTRLTLQGKPIGKAEDLIANKHKKSQDERKKIKTEEDLPDDYCGPCYGAAPKEGDCCNTCDELLEAYKEKRWRTDMIIQTAEQCIREGKHNKGEPKRMKKGEGCNLSGDMLLNRVAGNFHIAMGEGIERDGRHIHSFVPEDTDNFNASHIIHQLSFGAPEEESISGDEATMKGVTKIVSKQYGTTGLFQYFIKVVPTTYIKGSTKRETNRYFFTERFRPLVKEVLDDDYTFVDDDDRGVSASQSASASQDTPEGADKKDQKDQKAIEKKAEKKTRGVHAGHGGGHSNHVHHDVRNAILPGVFFIYEIYPFAVEISNNKVPFTHLLVRIMATIGGVFTIVQWVDAFIYNFLRSGRRR
jgi:hypothetical protein